MTFFIYGILKLTNLHYIYITYMHDMQTRIVVPQLAVMVGRRRGSGRCQSTPMRARDWLATRRTCSGKTSHAVVNGDNGDNDRISHTRAVVIATAAAR